MSAAPDFLKTMDGNRRGRSRRVAGLPALASRTCAGALATVAIRGRRLQFLRTHHDRAAGIAAALEACVRYTDRALGDALGQAYVEIAFSPATKQRTLTMVKQVEAAMERDINQLTWMSQPTKQQALEKLHAVVNKIGYPDHWRDYTALNVVRGDAIGNGQRANEFEFRRQLNKIGKPVDRGEWYLTPPTVNANYDPQNNDINFPAGVLQPPAFDMKMDDAPNYGNTGGTIGHELTHGFDDEGRQFDAKGNLRDWWQPQDEKEFAARAQCIEDQYAQYVVVDDVKINSKLTLGEDVADLGGLMLAYMAWRDETQGKKLQPIEGLTPEQRFFVGYAQSWCSNERPENHADAGQGRSALADEIPHERYGVEPAGVPAGVQVHDRPAHGSGQSLPRVVTL